MNKSMKRNICNELIMELKSYYGRAFDKSVVLEAQELLIKKASIGELEYFVELFENIVDIKKCGKAIIERGTPMDNLWYARKYPSADIKEHERVVLESKDNYCNYNFAVYVPGADKEAHLEVLKENYKNGQYEIKFGLIMNIERLEEIIEEDKIDLEFYKKRMNKIKNKMLEIENS